MRIRQQITWGVVAVLTACHPAQASSAFGVTIYKAPASASEPAPVAAKPPMVLTSAPAQRSHRRLSRRDRLRQTFADNAVETTLAPTPLRTAPATNVSTVPQTVKDGPHEEPAPTLGDLIAKHARENGVPPALATAVVRIESRFNPNARGGSAIGLMQIKVGTARSMGFAGGAAGLFQPDTNLHFGMKVLADAYRASNGDLCMTLARYQSGHRVTRMSAANRTYCARARSMMAKA